MTITPTKEQIEAELASADVLCSSLFYASTRHVVAVGMATARLEGEAKGRAQGLDDAAAIARAHDLSLMSMTPSDVTARMIEAGILAIKEKP